MFFKHQSIKSFRVLKSSILNSTSRAKYHYSIELKLNLAPNQNDKLRYNEPKFNFKKADWQKFKNLLEQQHKQINKSLDPSEINFQITNTIIGAANNSIPKSKKTTRFSKEFPSEIIKLIKYRRKLRRDIDKLKTKTKCQTSKKSELNSITKQINTKINEFYNNSWKEFVQKHPNPTSSRPFWKRINKFKNKSINRQIPKLIFNNHFIESDQEKSNVFKYNLESIFSNNETGSDDQIIKQKVDDYYNSFNKIEFKPITREEVLNAIKKTNTRSATGIDKIHNEMLRHLPNSSIELLVELFNSC